MRLIISVIGAFLLMVAMASHPQTLSQQEDVIKNLEGERGKAQVRGDIAKLDEVLAPEFMEINAAGQIRSKRENIEGTNPGKCIGRSSTSMNLVCASTGKQPLFQVA